MTTQEKIDVMQAYVDGKQIEFTEVGRDNWREYPQDLVAPFWNWERNNYRIKPEKKYRPYKDTNEMIADWAKRFGVVNWPSIAMPLIWLKRKDGGSKVLVCDFYKNALGTRAEFFHIDVALESFTYLDGSPCGKEIS